MTQSVAELVVAILDATQSDDIIRIDHLKSLIEFCSSSLSPADAELLNQLKSDLLFGQLQAIDSDDASELHAAKWELLTSLLRVKNVGIPASEEDLQTILRLMLADRFVSSDVLTAMAQWLVQFNSLNVPSTGNLLDAELPGEEQREGSYLELIKQMYVTLGGNSRLRQQLAEVLGKLVTTKDQAKQVVKSGVLRRLLQVALEQPGDAVAAVLMQNFELVGKRVVSLVCFRAAASGNKSVEKEEVALVDMRRRLFVNWWWR